MIIWDILVYIPDDWRILKQNPLNCVVLCFVSSRLFALGYVLLGVLERTMPFQHPRALSMINTFFGAFALISSTFLFLRRLHAVYSDSRWTRWAFSSLWVVHAVVEFLAPFGIRPTFIPGTHYYSDTDIKPYVGFSGILLLIFDTSVFLAISIKVATSHNSTDERVKWNTIVSGRALPRLSRAILQGGQQYYLMTAGATTLITVMMFIPNISPHLKMTLTIPIIPFEASMASRTYRNLRLYKLDPAISTTNPESLGTMTNVQSGCTSGTLSSGGIYNC